MKRLKTAKNLQVSEILILQRADSPDGVHGWALNDIFGEEEATSGAVYRRLGTLARDGYLASRIETDEQSRSHSGPIRRLYSTTEEGRAILGEAFNLMGVEVSGTEVTVAHDVSEEERAIIQQALPIISKLVSVEMPDSQPLSDL